MKKTILMMVFAIVAMVAMPSKVMQQMLLVTM